MGHNGMFFHLKLSWLQFDDFFLWGYKTNGAKAEQAPNTSILSIDFFPCFFIVVLLSNLNQYWWMLLVRRTYLITPSPATNDSGEIKIIVIVTTTAAAAWGYKRNFEMAAQAPNSSFVSIDFFPFFRTCFNFRLHVN